MNRTVAIACSIFVCLPVLLAPQRSVAQVDLERFFPPVVGVGEDAEVVAEGKFPQWPATIDVDRDRFKITTKESAGRLQVQVPENASPGPAWIRIRDSQSASAWFPLLVTRAKVVAADEPNDSLAEATPLTLPTTVAGRLEKSGDVDSFRISLTQGQRLIASVTANQLFRSPMDAILQLGDPDGNVLAQSEDVRGLDPQLVFHADRDRDVILRLFAFPETPNSSIRFSGASSFVYAIDVTTGPFIDHAFAFTDGEVVAFGANLPAKFRTSTAAMTRVSPRIAYAENALGWSWLPTFAEGWSIVQDKDVDIATLPSVVMGHIDEPSQVDTFTLSVQKGKRYRFDVRSKPDGFLLDSHLAIVRAADRKQLAENDDRERNGIDAGLDFDAQEDATIELQLRDLVGASGPRHFYQLRLQEHFPEVSLSVAAGQFAIKAGDELKLPITVTRRGGFAERLQVTAIGLPPGICAEPVISELEGDSAKSVELQLKAAKDATADAAFRVVAKPIDKEGKQTDGEEDDVEIAAAFELRPGLRVGELWLSTKEERD